MPENDNVVELEPSKKSKTERVKNAAIMTGVFVLPVALTVGSLAAGYKMTKLQLETAKVNLEAARLKS
jgi:hypothetical protein